MSEMPILFNAEMVRAILDGTKNQTRRPVKLAASGRVKAVGSPKNWHTDDPAAVAACPFGRPGDMLWVRETWAVLHENADDLPDSVILEECEQGMPWTALRHRASFPDLATYEDMFRRWRPSIHMPRWASRITLRVTDVRVQRVQDISEEDAVAEGVRWHDGEMIYAWKGISSAPSARAYFAEIWDSINEPRGFGWDANPWVWAVSFERVRP